MMILDFVDQRGHNRTFWLWSLWPALSYLWRNPRCRHEAIRYLNECNETWIDTEILDASNSPPHGRDTLMRTRTNPLLSDNNNPYRSPATETNHASNERPTRPSVLRSIFSILLGGAIVDFIGSYVGFFSVYTTLVFVFDNPIDAFDWIQSPSGTYLLKAIGISFSFAGGGTAAFVAGHYEKRHAIASACVALACSVLIQGVDWSAIGMMTMLACILAAAIAGKMVSNIRREQ